MKLILDNTITAVSADSSAEGYPASFILDSKPKRIWQADGLDTATLSCSVAGPIDTLAVFNTNAQSIAITITNPNAFQWSADDIVWPEVSWSPTFSDIGFDIQTKAGSKAFWGEFPPVTIPVTVDITLATATGSVVHAGVVVVGKRVEFRDPHRGIRQGLHDYSIEEKLQNGSDYYKLRDIVRTFDATITVDRDLSFYRFMHDFARTYGKTPKAWQLTGLNSFEWVVYARLTDMPSGAHSYPDHSPINFSLIEVI